MASLAAVTAAAAAAVAVAVAVVTSAAAETTVASVETPAVVAAEARSETAEVTAVTVSVVAVAAAAVELAVAAVSVEADVVEEDDEPLLPETTAAIKPTAATVARIAPPVEIPPTALDWAARAPGSVELWAYNCGDAKVVTKQRAINLRSMVDPFLKKTLYVASKFLYEPILPRILFYFQLFLIFIFIIVLNNPLILFKNNKSSIKHYLNRI